MAPIFGADMHLTRQIILWVVALSIINCSIDVADVTPAMFSDQQQVVGWNEFDSFVEYVAEEALDIENALPETEQNDQHNEHSVLKKTVSFIFAITFPSNHISYPEAHALDDELAEAHPHKPLAGYITLFSPPPDFC